MFHETQSVAQYLDVCGISLLYGGICQTHMHTNIHPHMHTLKDPPKDLDEKYTQGCDSLCSLWSLCSPILILLSHPFTARSIGGCGCGGEVMKEVRFVWPSGV